MDNNLEEKINPTKLNIYGTNSFINRFNTDE